MERAHVFWAHQKKTRRHMETEQESTSRVLGTHPDVTGKYSDAGVVANSMTDV